MNVSLICWLLEVMRKKIFRFASVSLVCMALVLCASCKKVKNCRCAVKGSQTVRMIELEKGSCDDLNYVEYDDPVHVGTLAYDTILCELVKE